MKRIIVLACAMLMALCMFGCSKEIKLTEYSNGEITLSLPEGMDEEFGDSDFEYIISKDDMIVYVSSITREELESYGYSDITLAEFTEELIDGDELLLRKSFSDHEVFAYVSKVDESEYYYLISNYETKNKFFIVNYVCFASDRSKFEDAFLDYATKVTFK